MRVGMLVRHLCDINVSQVVPMPAWARGSSGTAIRALEGPAKGLTSIVFTHTLAAVSMDEDPLLRYTPREKRSCKRGRRD